METLKLEHLAGYFNHDLKMYVEEIEEICTLFLINKDEGNFQCLSQDETEIYDSFNYIIKPLLYPLSCLTEEMIDDFDPFDKVEINLTIKYNSPIAKINFSAVLGLFKLHVDVYGLIGKGLAIDKRTVK